MTLYQAFRQDNHGKRFADVLNDPRINFQSVLDFLDNDARRIRMVDSEEHHLRPALAGVVRELEARPDVRAFLEKNDGHKTTRFRQAVGVAVRIVMEEAGWRTTGKKGSLGKRQAVRPGTTTPGAYRNMEDDSQGLALFFTRAERYQKTGDARSEANSSAQTEEND